MVQLVKSTPDAEDVLGVDAGGLDCQLAGFGGAIEPVCGCWECIIWGKLCACGGKRGVDDAVGVGGETD
jgi:hypothetical protein